MSNFVIFLVLIIIISSIHICRLQTSFETFDVRPECFGPASSECYLLYRGSYSWFGAHARCHSQGLALASITPHFGPDQMQTGATHNTWFVNAHRIWYNQSGPALEDGTLLTAIGRETRVNIYSNGNCYKLRRFEFSSIDCRQLVREVSFGCRLRADIDFMTNKTLMSCPSGWETPEFRQFKIPMCILEIASSNIWDASQAACIARGGRLFGVRNDLEALWFEQRIRMIRLKFGITWQVFILLNFHEFLYCTDGWCWNNGRHNLNTILRWLRGTNSCLAGSKSFVSYEHLLYVYDYNGGNSEQLLVIVQF